jgi:hypothetical protein
MAALRPIPRDRAAAVVQAGVVATCFALLLAGPNAFYPLLPVYQDVLGLDPLVLSLTFTLYVVVLVLALFALARPRFARWAALLVLTSLAMLFGSDLLLARMQESSMLLGRVLAGAAGGLGTGAASALVVAAVGARGRAVTATGNTVGAAWAPADLSSSSRTWPRARRGPCSSAMPLWSASC